MGLFSTWMGNYLRKSTELQVEVILNYPSIHLNPKRNFTVEGVCVTARHNPSLVEWLSSSHMSTWIYKSGLVLWVSLVTYAS